MAQNKSALPHVFNLLKTTLVDSSSGMLTHYFVFELASDPASDRITLYAALRAERDVDVAPGRYVVCDCFNFGNALEAKEIAERIVRERIDRDEAEKLWGAMLTRHARDAPRTHEAAALRRYGDVQTRMLDSFVAEPMVSFGWLVCRRSDIDFFAVEGNARNGSLQIVAQMRSGKKAVAWVEPKGRDDYLRTKLSEFRRLFNRQYIDEELARDIAVPTAASAAAAAEAADDADDADDVAGAVDESAVVDGAAPVESVDDEIARAEARAIKLIPPAVDAPALVLEKNEPDPDADVDDKK